MPGFLPCKCASVGEEGASGSWVPCVHHGHTPGYSIFSSCSFLSSGLRRGPAPWSGAHTDIKFHCSVPLCQLGTLALASPVSFLCYSWLRGRGRMAPQQSPLLFSMYVQWGNLKRLLSCQRSTWKVRICFALYLVFCTLDCSNTSESSASLFSVLGYLAGCRTVHFVFHFFPSVTNIYLAG